MSTAHSPPRPLALPRDYGPRTPPPVPVAGPARPLPWAGARWAFYLTALSYPFDGIMLVEGLNLTVAKVVWSLLLLAALAQPRACLGRVPVGLVWFAAYLVSYLAAGMLVAPAFRAWWGSFAYYLAVSLTIGWIGSNVMADARAARNAIIAFALGTCLLAVPLLTGIGVEDRGWDGMTRLTVLGQNPNSLAALCSLGMIVLLGLSRSSRGLRAFALPLAAVPASAMLMTGSRGSIVAAGVGMLAFLLDSGTPAQKARNFAAVALLAGLLAILSSSVFAERSKARRELRDLLVPEAIAMIEEAPFGWGPGRARYELARRVGLPESEETISPHNLFLCLVYEEGPLPTVAFLGGLWTCFGAARAASRGPQGSTPMALFLALMALNVTHAFHQERFFWFVPTYLLATGGRSLDPWHKKAPAPLPRRTDERWPASRANASESP